MQSVKGYHNIPQYMNIPYYSSSNSLQYAHTHIFHAEYCDNDNFYPSQGTQISKILKIGSHILKNFNILDKRVKFWSNEISVYLA